MAKIVWIDSDATTWIRNKGKLRKGEIAVEAVVEKDSARFRGDAWGVVIDSCLPVIHLIDTTRSTPYGIQQIQKLLGISCAFDQSVQVLSDLRICNEAQGDLMECSLRLSTSIRMVTKGVLREHLMLVANSMTCSGDLIGFNASGYKALFHSLKVQVPFTAATLVRPVKCFEQAAERCHGDSLSSIVASCSWGRHVTIGTGTPFQFLWSKKEVDSKQDAVADVYNFLCQVSCIANDEDRHVEPFYSPEHNSGFGRPTFEDRAGIQQNEESLGQENGKANWSCWGQAAAVEIKSNGWDVDNESKSSQSDQVPKSNAWSSWDSKIEALSSQSLQSSELPGTKSNVWSNACGDWNSNNRMETHVLEPPKSSEFCGAKSWDNAGNANKHPKKSSDQSNEWGGWCSSNKMESQAGESQSKTWGGCDNNKFETCENERNKPTEEHIGSNSWNKIIEEKQNSQSDQYTTGGHWKSSGKGIEWGQDDKSSDANRWDQSESNRSSEQGHSGISSWNRTDVHKKHPAKSDQSSPWGSWKSSEVKCLDQSNDLSSKPSVWDTDNIRNTKEQSSSSPSFSRWGCQSPKGAENEKSYDIGGWNEDREQDQLNQPTRSPVWGSSPIEKSSDTSWNMNNAQDWSNRPTRAPGWGSSGKGDRRNQRNRSTQSPAGTDGRNANGILTATGRRLDLFTCEEEEILKEVEPIMQSTKRIMHKPRFLVNVLGQVKGQRKEHIDNKGKYFNGADTIEELNVVTPFWLHPDG
ncbi:hypothetical protein ACLOJK_000895 [Asimina triloba]